MNGPDQPAQLSCVNAAVRYARRGWSVVPCAVRRDGHSSDGKAPRGIRAWQKLRLAPEEVPERFEATDNVGLLLGEASGGLVDVDCDCPEACRAAGLLLPGTVMRHGRASVGISHFWYCCPELQRGTQQFEDPEPPTADSTKDLKGTLVELRGSGGQTIVPPSLHVSSGEVLAWAAPGQLSPAPVALHQLNDAVARVAAAALIGRRWPVSGGRNQQALLLGGWLAKNGMPLEDAQQMTTAICAAAQDCDLNNRLEAVRASYAKHGTGDRVRGASELVELWGRKTMARLGKWLGFGPDPPSGAATASVDSVSRNKGQAGVNALRQALAVELEHHDAGNARRFIATRAAQWRHCRGLGGWLEWDADRWRPDLTNRVLHAATQVAKMIEAEAQGMEDQDRRSLTNYWAVRSQEKPKLDAMLALAACDPAVTARIEEFDAHPWHLALPGGTLDLSLTGLTALDRTRRAPAPDPSLRLTRLAGCAFDAAAECPQFEHFVATTFAQDQALIDFVQRLAGYCLFGGNPEQILAIFWGSGANGKSTLLTLLQDVLGEYGMSTGRDALLAREGGGNNQLYALAQLRGARLVVAQETGANGRLDEEIAKLMTGGDEIQARFSYGDFFSYRPQFTILMATNQLPQIRGTDEGIWRRVLVVPFEVTVPCAERDSGLIDRLRSELPGILKWCLTGLWNWHQLAATNNGAGLAPPPRVTAATREYRQDQDLIGEFLSECCELDAAKYSTAAELYCAYAAHCELNANQALSKAGFGKRLRSLPGLSSRRSGTARSWQGIALKPASPDPAAGVTDDAK